jgi:hypothetical protein
MSPVPDSTRRPANRAVAHTGPPGERVEIKLTPAQVNHLVRATSGHDIVSILLTRLDDVRAKLEDDPGQLKDKRLARSLLLGLLMLACYPANGSYMRNADVAELLGLDSSTTHRYVSTLVAAGLLVRDHATRQYRLAP